MLLRVSAMSPAWMCVLWGDGGTGEGGEPEGQLLERPLNERLNLVSVSISPGNGFLLGTQICPVLV